MTKLFLPNPDYKPPNANAPTERYIRGIKINSYFSKIDKPYIKTYKPQIINDCINYKNNMDIIITDSDKNLGPVMLNNHQYDQLVKKHLDNETVYQPLSFDEVNFIYLTTLEKILNNLSKLSSTFSSKYKRQLEWVKYKTILPSKVPKFRVIPKLQKVGPLSSRPISGAINWVTTPISKFISAYIQSFIENERTAILRDSKMLVQKIENKIIPSNAILVSFDVVSLYTNMRHSEVIKYLRKSLKSADELLLLELIELTLKTSVTQYTDKFYIQREGMAMGTNMAVLVANLFLHHALDESDLIYENLLFENMKLYNRYIDDTFLIWLGNQQELNNLHTELNQLIPGITFTMIASLQEIDALDVTIYKQPISATESILKVRPYQKSLAKYIYLPLVSSHQYSIKKGFIKGELIRYIRNSSTFDDFQNIRQLFFQRLLRRGYNADFIHQIFRSVNYADRKEYLKDKVNTSDNIIFVTRNNKRQQQMKFGHLLNNQMHLLVDGFHPTKHPSPIIAVKSGSQLRRYLYRSLTPTTKLFTELDSDDTNSLNN